MQSSIAVPGMSDKEVVVDKRNISHLGDNEGEMVPGGRNYYDFAGADAAPMVAEMEQILSFAASVTGDSMVTTLLEIMLFGSFDLNV